MDKDVLQRAYQCFRTRIEAKEREREREEII